MANKTITYDDLSLEGLIRYYETKKGPRAKMTLSYLKESRDVYGQMWNDHMNLVRGRMAEMRKHPSRQDLFMKAQKAEQKTTKTLCASAASPAHNRITCDLCSE